MRPGNLDQRVTFQAVTRVADNMGGATETWGNVPSVPTVWANVVPLKGREMAEADRVAAKLMVRVTVRHRTDIAEDDRLLWKGEAYNIRTIKRAGSRVQYLELEAERGAAT